MSNAYVITKGEYDEYSIVGVFSTKEKADEMCALLNANPWNGHHDVEEYPLDAFPEWEEKTRGYRGSYNLSHGFDVDVENVVLTEAFYTPSYEGDSEVKNGSVVAFGNTREKCLQVLLDAVSRKKYIDSLRKNKG